MTPETLHLRRMFRDQMRNWALIWRQWRDICPITAGFALESAKIRRAWAQETP